MVCLQPPNPQPPLWGAPRPSLPRETGSVLEWGRSSIADLLKGSPVEGIAYELNNDVTEAVRWLVAEMPKSRPPPLLSHALWIPAPVSHGMVITSPRNPRRSPAITSVAPPPRPCPRPLLRSSAECPQSVPAAAPTHAFLWNPMAPSHPFRVTEHQIGGCA